MPIPKKPAKSFVQIMELIAQGHYIPAVFSYELLIAIFWEETLFNNVKQNPGTAVGFGQVEPSEFYKFKTDFAKKHGYYVANLPRTMKVGKTTRLLGTLTDVQAVQVASAALRHNYHARKRIKLDALYVYGGVYYAGKSPLTKQKRISIINGWLACEAHLKKIPDLIHWVGLEDQIIEGLKMAKPFNKTLEAEFRPILFPESVWKYPQWLQDYLQILNSTPKYLQQGSRGNEVKALQAVLNFKNNPASKFLAEDGIFGPKTRTGVVQFQRGSQLSADGIVGPKTKSVLSS